MDTGDHVVIRTEDRTFSCWPDALPLGRQVCIYSQAVPRRSLQQPTEGEARLHLQDPVSALRHYALVSTCYGLAAFAI